MSTPQAFMYPATAAALLRLSRLRHEARLARRYAREWQALTARRPEFHFERNRLAWETRASELSFRAACMERDIVMSVYAQ